MPVQDAAANPDFPIFFLFAAVVFLILFLVVALIAFLFARDWARSFLSGAGVSLFDIVGMKLRRSDSKTVIDCRIMSVQGGAPIPVKKLEAAYLAAADIRTVTMAYIETQKTGQVFSFDELVDASRSDRLAEILKMK